MSQKPTKKRKTGKTVGAYKKIVLPILDSKNATNAPGDGVILNPIPNNDKVPKKDTQYRKISFTLNNYKCSDVPDLLKKFKPEKYIIGNEIGESGTPHLQGYFDFGKAKKRFSYIVKHGMGMHFEASRGDLKSNFKYCSKDGDFKTNIKEDDWLSFQEKVDRIIMAQEYPNVQLRRWQQRIVQILNSRAQARKIWWFWEPVGNVGKSWFTKLLTMKYKNFAISEGKMADVFNQIMLMMAPEDKSVEPRCPEIIFVDIPREHMEGIRMATIEKLKNGLFYSGKYKGGICRYPWPHVIIFANKAPDLDSVSKDRWNVVRIGDETDEEPTQELEWAEEISTSEEEEL